MFNLNVMKTGGMAAAVFVCAFLIILTPFAQAATVPNSASFDHAKTGFQLRDIHTTLRCEQCHVDGIFKNTPRNCAGCHSIGSLVGATPKPANHVQTNLGCDTCHTSPTSFLVKSYNHAGVSDKCASCHNGQYPSVVSKTASHFPTLFPCETCHNSVTSFANARMQHTGISTGCIRCHNGQFPSAESRLPTHSSNSLACEACHTNFTTFDGAFFDHSTTPVTGVCNTCHGVKPRVTAKPVGHFPTTTTPSCDGNGACHTQTNTNNYRSFVGATYSHSPADACSNCHTGSYTNAFGKPPTHVLTSSQCSTCHTASTTSNYSSFNCVPAAVNCYTPHETQGVCSTCHNGVVALGKAASHIFTTLACDTCHKSSTTFLGATYFHSSPPGVCSTCHNGVTATGKPTYHVPTIAACDSSDCHTASISQINTATPTFTGVVYAHTAPIGVCSTCHNGTTGGPKSKPANHVTTSSPCDKCHTASTTSNYSSFKCAPAAVNCYTPHETQGVCSTCHNGGVALGKAASHIFTTSACDTCHKSSTTFLGATYFHSSPPGVCSTCHNGVAATGKPTYHVPTIAACDSSDCHTASISQINTATPTFGGVIYVHVAPLGVCSTCHNGTASGKGKSATHVTTSSACDKCHTASTTSNYSSFKCAPAAVNCYTPHEIVTTCSNCHNGTNALGLPASHVPTKGLGCDSCHTAINTDNYTHFTGASGGHTNPAADAGKCHNCHGPSAKGTSDFAQHIPVSGMSCDAGGCHKYSGVPPTFSGALMNGAAHAVVADRLCTACHGVPTYKPQGAGGPFGMNNVTQHVDVNTTLCTTCHSVTTYSGIASWSRLITNRTALHNAMSSTKCEICHTRGYLYQVGNASQEKNGHKLGKVCTSCHKNAGSYLDWSE